MKMPARHAHGSMYTNGVRYAKSRSKNVRNRIRRWAKRIMKRSAS